MGVINFTGLECGDFSECWTNTNATVQSSVTAGPWSAYAARCSASGSNPTNFELAAIGASGSPHIFAPHPDTCFVRFLFRVDTLPASGNEEIFVCFNRFALRITPGGTLVAYDGILNPLTPAGTTVLSAGVWYRIEIMQGTGNPAAWEVRVNGVVDLAGTADFSGGEDTYFFGRFNQASNTVLYYYDDIMIRDDAYPGNGRSVLLAPSADGFYTSGTPNGAAARWQCVREVPHNGDTTYVNAIAEGDTFTSAVGANPNIAAWYTIPSVKVLTVSRGSGGSAVTGVRLRSGSTNNDVAGGFVFGTYEARQLLASTNPATGGAWSLTTLSAAQVGVPQTVAGDLRVTATYLLVDFVPAPPPPPYYFSAAAHYAAGAAAGMVYAPGAAAGLLYGAGAVAGQVSTE